MADIKDRAREYLAKHSKYSEVFGQTFVAVDTLTAMVDFAEQETKELAIKARRLEADCKAYNFTQHTLQEENAELKAQFEKFKSVVVSERDEALRLEDVITYSILNDILDKWEMGDGR